MTTSDTGPDVRVEYTAGVAHVVLNRPDSNNALSLQVACALRDAVMEAVGAPGVRTVLLRAAGARFSVGGDLRSFREAEIGANLNDAVARPINDTIEVIAAAHQPVVCAVQGAVGGGAFGLMLSTDIIIAADSAVFRTGYTGSGLTPDCGVTWLLPRIVGMPQALDILLTNRRISAAEALDLGLVSRVVPADGLEAAVEDVLGALRRVPVATLSETKRLVRRSTELGLHSQLDDEARTIGRIGDTADTREAIAAFLDKRVPSYSA